MWNVYLICAVVGGTVFVLQMILTLIGGGGHDFDGHDGSPVVDHDAHFWGVFSLRAIVAGVTAFGLGGLLVKSAGGTTVVSAPVAIGSFFAAALLVAGMLRMMGKFSADGTTRIQQAVGRPGVVYVNIPADRQGPGKVHLDLQNRTVEVEAITYGNALATGTRVVVTSVIGSNMVEVIAAPEMSREFAV
jgi:membrane protein implicated in regulation of membrane protease activity